MAHYTSTTSAVKEAAGELPEPYVLEDGGLRLSFIASRAALSTIETASGAMTHSGHSSLCFGQLKSLGAVLGQQSAELEITGFVRRSPAG